MKLFALYSILKYLLYIPYHLFFLFRVRYIGRKNMPKDGPVVVCCNHISLMDPVFVICLFRRRIRFMAKAEAFKNPFMNWFLRNAGVFPIRRGEADIEAIKTAMRILKDGGVLGIFPEGHRQRPGEPRGESQAGGIMLAAKTNATVLPVAITGKDSRIRIFRKVVIKCGEPIPCDQLGLKAKSNEEYKRVSKEIMDKIYALKAEIDF